MICIPVVADFITHGHAVRLLYSNRNPPTSTAQRVRVLLRFSYLISCIVLGEGGYGEGRSPSVHVKTPNVCLLTYYLLTTHYLLLTYLLTAYYTYSFTILINEIIFSTQMIASVTLNQRKGHSNINLKSNIKGILKKTIEMES